MFRLKNIQVHQNYCNF